MEQYALVVGKYTDGPDDGIRILANPEGDFLNLAPLCTLIDGADPSYLAWDSKRNLLFAASELASMDKQSGGELHCWHWEKGEAKHRGKISVAGASPCSLALIPETRLVFTSNYSSGNITVASYDEDGTLSGPQAMIERTGSGPDKERQEASHPHCVYPHLDGRGIYLADLGTDEIMNYRFKYTGSWFQLKSSNSTVCTPGSGPRHFRINPTGEYACALTELANTLLIYSLGKGRLQLLSEVSLLPDDFNGESYGSEVLFSSDNRFIYAANRIHNTIVRFCFNGKTGAVTDPQWISCEGKFPRHIGLSPDGNYLLSANQHSNDVTVFKRDQSTGNLTYTGVKYEVSTPSFVLFIPRY